ncbi:hypothetical protein AXE77_00810 [Gardnerella vaginalis]|uniref:Uncharacterized protein n=1 Tax=Gardnerella vaginalis TaxID=2702 RepID=A0A3E1J153_GARVA|nr:MULTISPECIES: hypothetical protein [Gardnerella]RFD80093.1 hypothetical protein AXE77_00810 [Gardnerella vaginalis]
MPDLDTISDLSTTDCALCKKYHIPNADTLAAFEEAKQMKYDPNVKTYSSFAELLKDIEDE